MGVVLLRVVPRRPRPRRLEVAPAIDRLAGGIADTDPVRWPNLVHDQIEDLVRRRIVGSVEAAQLGSTRPTARAAESTLASAAHDPALRHSFWLLTQILTAAKSDNFVDA